LKITVVCIAVKSIGRNEQSKFRIVSIIINDQLTANLCKVNYLKLEGARESAYLRQVKWFKQYYCKI